MSSTASFCSLLRRAALLVLLAPLSVPAQTVEDDAAGFAACIGELQASARAAGVSEAVVRDVLGKVSRAERVIELDRKQPEFTRTFADYYNNRVTEQRVTQGRELLATHRKLLNEVQRDYGIPAQYLVAFWGLETNFGSYFGNLPVPGSLATLACDERRASFFAAELLAALQIIDKGDIPAERMIGSWAGAMGHVQFLPSVFQRFAIDADGDGKRNIWDSVPDAMASAGNFLQHLGWQRGYRWGREVRVPEGFDYSLSGHEQPRPLSDWVDDGITDAYGGKLPRLDIPASLLVPSGQKGPAFLVYDNFEVIMRWNRSEYYALAVGRLADRIAGSAPLTRAPADGNLRLSHDDVRELQASLQTLGFDPGNPDGLFGPATRRALSRFQQANDLIADGHPDDDALASVRRAATQ